MVYRANSVFRKVWRMAETVVIHKRASPHFTKSEGPISHSPLPMVPPSAMIDGPRIAIRRRKGRGLGGFGRSVTSNGGPKPPGRCAATAKHFTSSSIRPLLGPGVGKRACGGEHSHLPLGADMEVPSLSSPIVGRPGRGVNQVAGV